MSVEALDVGHMPCPLGKGQPIAEVTGRLVDITFFSATQKRHGESFPRHHLVEQMALLGRDLDSRAAGIDTTLDLSLGDERRTESAVDARRRFPAGAAFLDLVQSPGEVLYSGSGVA